MAGYYKVKKTIFLIICEGNKENKFKRLKRIQKSKDNRRKFDKFESTYEKSNCSKISD